MFWTDSLEIFESRCFPIFEILLRLIGFVVNLITKGTNCVLYIKYIYIRDD